ncbi:MAG: heavy-metal-associated domain-containing protein [Thermostichales cyanobacterium SZTDM-1c_bins_54]
MVLELTIPKLACADCVATVTKVVQGLDPAAQVSGDPKTKRVTIETGVAGERIRAALEQAGYGAV